MENNTAMIANGMVRVKFDGTLYELQHSKGGISMWYTCNQKGTVLGMIPPVQIGQKIMKIAREKLVEGDRKYLVHPSNRPKSPAVRAERAERIKRETTVPSVNGSRKSRDGTRLFLFAGK